MKKKPRFSFSDEQGKKLLACWKRPGDREIATSYLKDVELLIEPWQNERVCNKTTSIKQQIAIAYNLQITFLNNVEKVPALLEQLPQDFEMRLASVWLYHKYGDGYFLQHREACRKDVARNSGGRLALEALIRGWSPEGAPKPDPIKTEVSKLPPNYFQQNKADADFLRIVASAAREISSTLKLSMAWLDRPAEEGLIFSLVYAYELHFGKLPSAAVEGQQGYASPFRSFLTELAGIINEKSPFDLRECKFGAPITRKILFAIKSVRLSSCLPSFNNATK